MSGVQTRLAGGRQQKFVRTYNNVNNNNKFVQRKRFQNKGQGQMNGPKTNKPNRDAIIRQNLAHMKQVAQKKRVAQERYYNNKNSNGRSPMIKTASGPFMKQENMNRGSIQQRLSVQQRLGNRGNNMTAPKKPVFVNTRPNTNKMVTGMRSDKIQRVQNMQQKKARFRNPGGAIKTVNAAGKVVYLQPVLRRPPNNYTVRVLNDHKHHVNQGLNPVLQQEIKLIQNKSRQIITPVAPVHQQVQTNLNVDRLPIVATSRTLHERFSMI